MSVKKCLTDEDIKKSALNVIIWKGYPYSASEYEMSYVMEREHLIKNGATKKQLRMFDQIVNKAPIRGGRFSSHSGD